MTQRRWTPDPNLILAARNGGIRGANLGGCDRAWAVALLMEGQGLTGAEAASTLRCSLRLVRLIRADPLYPLAAHAAGLQRQLADTETAAQRQLRDMARNLNRHAIELGKTKAQRDRLITDLADTQRQLGFWKGRCA